MESNFLYKCKKKKIFGVCSGLAKSFSTKSIYFRSLFFLLTMVGGLGIVIYLILFLSLDREHKPNRRKLLGVCYFFAKKYRLDLSVLRVITFYIGIITGIIPGIIVYLFLWLLITGKSKKSQI